MWHKPCRTFHPWCPCIKTRCLYIFMCIHDDVIEWKHFPRHWPFVRGIHRWPVNSPHKGQWRGAFDVSFDLRMNNWLSKQSLGWWFETLSRPLWRHCNDKHAYIASHYLNQCWLIAYFAYRNGFQFPRWHPGVNDAITFFEIISELFLNSIKKITAFFPIKQIRYPAKERRVRYDQRIHMKWLKSQCLGSRWSWKFSWWRHQMETFSALLALCGGNHQSPVDSPHKGQWRGALMFLWSAPKQTVDQTLETPVIWYAIALIVTSLKSYWIDHPLVWYIYTPFNFKTGMQGGATVRKQLYRQ